MTSVTPAEFAADAIPTDAPALAARAVRHRFGGSTALAAASLTVQRDEVVALVGASGSGKTTLLRCFNRLVEPEAGTITVRGVDVRATDPIALRRSIGYVPQQGGLQPHWTVARNVALVPTLARRTDVPDRVREALALVGLGDVFAARYPQQLSGGERQRVAIARALADTPSIVLLDEPFGALDAIARAALHEAFAAVRARRRFAALLVTHDLAEAARLADSIAVMDGGRVVQHGPLSSLRAAPATPFVASLLAHAETAAGALLARDGHHAPEPQART